MDLRDLTVEVRDVNLRRLGQIEPGYLRARLEPAYAAPGAWNLTLPSEHPMATVLEQPGAGIIVTHTDPAVGIILSGPRTEPDRTASTGDPRGTTQFTGTTDNVVLWNRVAYPTPSQPLSNQNIAYDVITNVTGEAAMRYYVQWNAGPSALANRRVLTLEAVNQNRGSLVTKSARYDNLGDLLASIAAASGLGFRVVQIGSRLEFQTLTIRDRRKRVRLDLANGTLASQNVKRRAPSATAMIVAGQGVGGGRTIVERVNATAEVTAYGPFSRVEVFKDQRNTDDLLELQQAGDEGLADGAPSLAVTAVPGDDSTMAYPLDWGLGDSITVVVDNQETSARVNGATILVDRDTGVRIGASIGDVQGWDPQAPLRKAQEDTNARVSSLERTVEAAGMPTGTIIMWGGVGSSPPSGWLRCDGSAVSRTTYAALFAAIGTGYGAGNGSTTFALPQLSGRFPFGEFGASYPRGGAGGATTHQHTLSDAGIAAIIPAAVYPRQIVTRRVNPGFNADWVSTHAMTTRTDGQSGVEAPIAQAQNIGAALRGYTDWANGMPPYTVVNYLIRT